MKCIIIKSYNPQRKPIAPLYENEELDEYIYTYILENDDFVLDKINDYCFESDEDTCCDGKKYLQFYRGEHWILNCIDVDTTTKKWKKDIKNMYPQLIICCEKTMYCSCETVV
jgi:hypothetical protein